MKGHAPSSMQACSGCTYLLPQLMALHPHVSHFACLRPLFTFCSCAASESSPSNVLKGCAHRTVEPRLNLQLRAVTRQQQMQLCSSALLFGRLPSSTPLSGISGALGRGSAFASFPQNPSG